MIDLLIGGSVEIVEELVSKTGVVHQVPLPASIVVRIVVSLPKIFHVHGLTILC